jgi:hypothetical protein
MATPRLAARKLGIIGMQTVGGPVDGRVAFGVYWFRDSDIPLSDDLVDFLLRRESYLLMLRLCSSQIEGPFMFEVDDC